jgi:hypothetical protein
MVIINNYLTSIYISNLNLQQRQTQTKFNDQHFHS